MKINQVPIKELFDRDTILRLKEFTKSMLAINYNKYYEININFAGSTVKRDHCIRIYSNTPQSISKFYGVVVSKSLNIDFYIQLFVEKYGHYDVECLLTLYKEEVIRELYKLGVIHNRKPDYNQMIWNLACDLESGSYYDFVYGITPELFTFPSKLSADSYYWLLKKNINDMMKQQQQEQSNSSLIGIPSSDNNKDRNNEDKDKRDSNDNGGDNDDSLQSSNDTSENDSENIESDVKDKDNDKVSDDSQDPDKAPQDFTSENVCDELSGDALSEPSSPSLNANSNSTGYSPNASENDIRQYLESLKLPQDIIESEMHNVLCSNPLSSDIEFGKNGGIYLKEVMVRNETNDEVFNSINRYISNFENQTTITKVHKEKSFKKYSWKTDDRHNNILYPGTMKYRSGAIKVFESAPVIFFDFSSSTSGINNQLNVLLYTFWSKGFICCTYNSELTEIYKPKDYVFKERSRGGTNTLGAINRYFQIEEKEEEGIHRNIYVITDGAEYHNRLFKEYPSTKIFRLIVNNDKITIMLKQFRNNEIKETLFFGEKVKNKRSSWW